MSKASLSRAQRIVDTAYMLWWRHDWQQRGPRYYFGLVDSSTQGHKAVDWLNSQMHYVLKTDLIKVYDAWRFLVGLVDRQHQAFAAAPHDGDGAQPVTQEELRLGEFRLVAERCVKAGILEHTMPPVGLGRRATATEFKIRAWLHALALEHGSDEVMADALQSFVSLTTDLGAESGIADYECLRWRDFLPRWQDDVRLEMDDEPLDGCPLGRGAQPEALLP